MKFADNDIITIYSDVEPKPCERAILPYTTEKEAKKILKKPYINERDVNFYIEHNGYIYDIFIEEGYTWDGASIPFGFRWMLGGKGNPEFLIPSMVHDIMCENKDIVNRNRKLSSLIFYYLLLACKCNKLKAKIMYAAVDNFQKLFGGWNNE